MNRCHSEIRSCGYWNRDRDLLTINRAALTHTATDVAVQYTVLIFIYLILNSLVLLIFHSLLYIFATFALYLFCTFGIYNCLHLHCLLSLSLFTFFKCTFLYVYVYTFNVRAKKIVVQLYSDIKKLFYFILDGNICL